MHIDFSSAIDNALLVAAREAALRRNARNTVKFKSSRWSALPNGVRSVSRSRSPSAPVTEATPVVHAH